MNLITINQASEFLSLKTSRLRHMVFMKQIPFIKIGASILFDKTELEIWLNEKSQEVVNV